MELLNFFQKDKSIECFVRALIDGFLNIQDVLKVLDDDPDFVEDNLNVSITYNTFLELIDMSYGNKKYGMLLTYILEFIDCKYIDDLVFEKIYNYPIHELKEDMLICLSHKKLKENQLIILCNTGIAFECYYELAILYYTSSIYSYELFKNFLLEVIKSKYSYILEDLINELKNFHIASCDNKNEYIKNFTLKNDE